MKKWLIVTLVALGAIALGVGGAYAADKLLPAATITTSTQSNNTSRWPGGMWGFQGWNDQDDQPGTTQYRGMGPGMMQRYFDQYPSGTNVQKITLDEAVKDAETYLQNLKGTFKVAQVIEFPREYYVAVTESDSGRGAIELEVNALTGRVEQEMGPGQVWNLKYNPTGLTTLSDEKDNKLTIDQARAKATEAIKDITGATLNEGGFSFYGYYTFDYSVNGKITGIVSVNGLDGRVMFHNLGGQIVQEKEY